MYPGVEVELSQVGKRSIREADIALCDRPSQCHLYIVALVLYPSIVVKEREQMLLINEVLHGSNAPKAYFILALGIEVGK